MSILLKDLTLGYGERTLLSHVTTEFRPASLTALIGRNGTGKSTLLRTIAGINPPCEGSVKLCGHPLECLSAPERARLIATVTTDKVRIPNLSCEEVVSLGRAPYTNWIGRLQEEDRAAVDAALETVGMSAFARKHMDAMSDGECQRVMIARALAQDTPVILLDEPTAFLDLPNRYSLVLLLGELARKQGKCIVFSTHDLDIALNLCDTVALIDSPRLTHLSPEAMMQSGRLERLFTAEGMEFDPKTRQLKFKMN